MRCVVFTKPPVPGTCKTRLIPAIGAQGAADLHAAMACDVLETAQRAGLSVQVSLAGDMDHPWVQTLGVPVTPQVSGDLGARMLAALGDGPAMALGTDAPTLPLSFLQQAAELSHPLVLGPAFDGGYWTLAWQRPIPELMQGMRWSTDSVLSETMLRARSLGVEPHLLPFWYDVDTPKALALLKQQLRILPEHIAPRTRSALHALGHQRSPHSS
ncbi:MAG: rSAM/selenodomain-associated transferase 1 [Cognaticolwellia sp.]|jgi:rSAM/selenodomain-associated transferase 1